MFIKKLLIKNYRCFGDSPTVIEFSNSGLTALIGANNVGKSTALRALEILLGDRWPTGQFNEDDFNNNRLDKEITLACEFNAPIAKNIYGVDYDILGVIISAKHIQSGYGESSVETNYYIIDNIADFDNENWTIATYRDRPLRINQETKNNLPIVITIPLIKLHFEQPTNKWSVLGKMLQKIEKIFITDSQREERFRGKMKEAVGILREPSEFQQIETNVKDFWEKMKPSNLSGTTLEFLDYEPWRYYRQFKLAVKRNGREVPIETLGEGVQRLAIIALYRTYLKYHGRNEKAVLLIEEPESYLHPQARRTLFDILKKAIKEEGDVEGQIIYTTHSENFIDCGDFDDIVIFSQLASDDVEVRHISEEILKNHTIALSCSDPNISDQHIHYRLIETITQGLKEALFTRKAIIVEGSSEVELFRFFTNIDKEQIAIVSAGGKNNIPSIYSFLTAFGISCFIVIDRDEKNKDENKKIVGFLNQANAQNADSTRMTISEADINKIENGKIEINNRLMIFGKNLETVLENEITNYKELLKILRQVFNLPNDSKPRDIQALGLAYSGIYNRSQDLEDRITDLKSQLNGLSNKLDGFIKQELYHPNLLKPRTLS